MRGQNGACLPPYTRSRDPKIGPTSIYQTVSLGNLVNRGNLHNNKLRLTLVRRLDDAAASVDAVGFRYLDRVLLLATVGIYRWSRILMGRVPIREFRADEVEGKD